MSRWPSRPRLSPSFYKAHGLGNDYLVFEEGEAWRATPENVRRVCDRFRGVGSDGIVALLNGGESGGSRSEAVTVRARMFNPDGGEFERSGNGLRVLGSWLARRHPMLRRIVVEVGGDRVVMSVHGSDGPVHDLSVEMGRAAIGPGAVAGEVGAFDLERPEESGRTWWSLPGPRSERLDLVPVSVGNPHLVVLVDEPTELTEDRLRELGPFLSAHPALRHGANVQLAGVVSPGVMRALVWERGVGRTEASGTSACAVAVAMVASGRASPGPARVHMPGGTLETRVGRGLEVTLRGPVEEVLEGRLTPASVATFERGP